MAGRGRSARLGLPRSPRGLRGASSRATPRRRASLPAQHKRAIKRATMRDCGRRCVYCASPLEPDIATLDHVYPVAHGGAHVPGNLVVACARCNRLKGDLLPQEFFLRYPWAGANFIHYARAVHRALKRVARRAASLAFAAEEERLAA